MTRDELLSLVLYETENLLVINKPAGLLVHQVARDSIALTDYLPMLGDGVHLAHRLDRDTSGCLVLGRNPHTLKRLGKQFTNGDIKKTYHALVTGHLEGEGSIDAPLFKENARMNVREDGVTALTEWRALEQRGETTLVELRPITGRTNQLRAHLQHLGYPIMGDEKYGGPMASRMMLHASSIEIPEMSRVTAPLPF